MNDILKIIFDCSIKNKILNDSEIENIIIILIYQRKIDNFISNIYFDDVEINGLASYNMDDKKITIYNRIINKMIKNMNKNLLINNSFQKYLFENLSILQIILHELEHVNQNNIICFDNSFEALIIRLSRLIDINIDEQLYEICPTERLAEIKSYKEVINIVLPIKEKILELEKLLNSELLKRKISGYHYQENIISYPLLTYFSKERKDYIINFIDLGSSNDLDYRFKYGLPISFDEYKYSLKKLINDQKYYYKNKIILK